MRSVKRLFRFLREARFPDEKFWNKDGAPIHAELKGQPRGTVGTTSKDYEPKPEPVEPETIVSDFTHLIPIPFEDSSKEVKTWAKSAGFKKISSWLVNPKHWDRGQQNDSNSLNWEGTDWIKPVTPQAKEVMRIIKADKLRPVDVIKPQIWDKHFAHKFGQIK